MTLSAHDINTQRLLRCGLVAGPLYVAITLIQAFTRAGFDITQHRFTQLTSGEFGVVHQLNMIVVGVLTLLFAIGLRRVLHSGRGGSRGPLMVALLGVAYAFGGLFTADPVVGMPPGTTSEMVQTTLQGQLQNATRTLSTLFLVVASIILSVWFFTRGERLWGWIVITLIPATFAVLTLLGSMLGGNPVALAFLATPWIWLTTVAWRLHTMNTLHHL